MSYIGKYPTLAFWFWLAVLTPFILESPGLWHHNDIGKRLLAMAFFYAAVFVLVNFATSLWRLCNR